MKFRTVSSRLTAVVCTIALAPGSVPAMRAEPVSQEASAPAQAAPKIPNDQLDALVAPIALYPDPLLAQVLAASTYPLEIMQLQQWLAKNKNLKDKALTDAVAKQPWDSSVQAMAPIPDLVKRLADDIQWTTDLGNAFLAQQSDVMDAVQRMRAKAKDTGNLKSSEQVKVETKVIESKSVVVIQQSNPEVVYVPSYNPTVVYGPPVYPYPPVSYPPPGYYAAGMAISFGVGVAMGAAWGGGWGNCGWGGNNDITINNNNNYNRNTNVSGGNRNTSVGSGNRGGNSSWNHNPQHRGGAPYANKATANKYGGTARGDPPGNRQADARQRQQSGTSNRSSGGAGDRGGDRAGSIDANRGAGGDRGGNRASAGSSNRGGGGDRIGDRSVSSGSSGGAKGGAFGGSSGGTSSARASSSRGSSSMGGSRGGGGGRRR
jgi:Protein of unknown function (DUF3300)